MPVIPSAPKTPDINDESRRLEALVLDDEFILAHLFGFPAKPAEALYDCPGRLPFAARQVEHINGDDIRAPLWAALGEHNIGADSEGVDGDLSRRTILRRTDATRGEQHNETKAGQATFISIER